MSLRRADETNGRGQSRNGVTGHRGNVGAAISDGDRLLEVLRVGLEQKLSVSQGDSVGVNTGGVEDPQKKTGGAEDPQKPRRDRAIGPTPRMQGGVRWASDIHPGFKHTRPITKRPSAQALPNPIKEWPSLQARIDSIFGILSTEEKAELLKCVNSINRAKGRCTRLLEGYEAQRLGLKTAGAANNNLDTDDVLELWDEDDFKQADSLLTKKQERELTAMTHSDRAGASDGGASESKTPDDMLSSWALEKEIKNRESPFPNLFEDLPPYPGTGDDDDDDLFRRFL